AYRTLESDFGCRGSPRKYDAHLPVFGTLGDPGCSERATLVVIADEEQLPLVTFCPARARSIRRIVYPLTGFAYPRFRKWLHFNAVVLIERQHGDGCVCSQMGDETGVHSHCTPRRRLPDD